ncbi:MAG: hypothetical protein EOO73_07300 [Myxococcales bacterium]|nr:MAG: hypothetical protein EOO73_07300 [Myxococcales bacterium]
MSTLERLLVTGEDELERALLGSSLTEAPSQAGLHDTALALGLTASAATALVATLPSTAGALGALSAEATSVTAPLGAAAAPGIAASSVAATAGVASLTTLGKSLIGGALVSFLALTTVDQTLGSPPNERSRPAARAALAAPARTSEPALAFNAAPVSAAPSAAPATAEVAPERGVRRSAAPASSPVGTVVPLPSAPPRAVSEPEAPPREAKAPPTDASLAAETRLLDRARAALIQGDTPGASRLLEQYDSGHPSRVLSYEAALLRVRLLLATGQRARAAAQARRIISSYPENVHADSLRRLAAEP